MLTATSTVMKMEKQEDSNITNSSSTSSLLPSPYHPISPSFPHLCSNLPFSSTSPQLSSALHLSYLPSLLPFLGLSSLLHPPHSPDLPLLYSLPASPPYSPLTLGFSQLSPRLSPAPIPGQQSLAQHYLKVHHQGPQKKSRRGHHVSVLGNVLLSTTPGYSWTAHKPSQSCPNNKEAGKEPEESQIGNANSCLAL